MKPSLNRVSLDDYPRLKQTEYVSPFRYPGGKAFLTGYLASALAQMPKADERAYAEPYCGGAGAAFALLGQGHVTSIHLNDKDVRIFSAWRAILSENERFLATIKQTPVTIKSWHKFQEMISDPDSGYSFELGFATFFINRTSRSGIILGSGPIGGYEQSGKWKIDARYYKETMLRRIKWIGELSDKVTLSNKDGIEFLTDCAQKLDGAKTLYFIDPPYVQAGSRLYLNGMTDQLHTDLALLLKSEVLPHWVLTYDNDPLIQDLYASRDMRYLSVNYSLRKTRKENELLVR